MAGDKVTKPGQVRVSPYNTHLRDMQKEAMKRAQEKKILDQMEKNHQGKNNTWDNGYTN
jgi:hypothetical protein